MIRALARTMSALVIATSLFGCGSATTAPNGDNGTVTATSDLQFTPSSVRITLRNPQNPTATVTWVFQSVTHSVVWDARPVTAEVFDIGNTSNASVSREFHLAGTYTYHCAIHTSMTGTVIVH